MSGLIPPGSTKNDRAIRFGEALTSAMRRRKLGSRTVAEALGSSRTSVMYWRTGRILPRIDTADRLAQVCGWAPLAALARTLRRKTCEVCPTVFIDDSGSDNRRYCSPACQRVAEKRRVGVSREHRAAVAERALLAHKRAVAAYCRACEPEGRCTAPECELRAVSPLPLVGELEPLERAVPKPPNGVREPGAQSAVMLGVWDRYTPHERTERSRRAAEGRYGAKVAS